MAYVSELAQFVNRQRRMSTAILRCPTGIYTIVGTVPLSVCNDTTHSTPKAYFDTEEDAKQALIKIGLPFFQLADCSWYPRKPETDDDRKALDAFWNG